MRPLSEQGRVAHCAGQSTGEMGGVLARDSEGRSETGDSIIPIGVARVLRWRPSIEPPLCD